MERALFILSPLDVARRSILTRVGPYTKRWLVDRERRVAALFAFVVVSSFLSAAFAPLLLLALGPIMVGVPHLLADVRYLVVQPRLHRRLSVWAAVAVPLAALAITVDARWGWAALFGAACVSRGAPTRRVVIGAVALALVALTCLDSYLMAFAVAHLHNLVAVAVLFAWSPKRSLVSVAPFVLFALASLFILAGAAMPLVALTHGFGTALGVDADTQMRTLAPFQLWTIGDWPARLVVFFAFAQSVHYGVWLRVVPDEARKSKTPRSFTMSARALLRDCGPIVVAAAVALSIGLAAWAIFDLASARDGYFRFAIFHGYLEFAAFALFFCEAPRKRAAA